MRNPKASVSPSSKHRPRVARHLQESQHQSCPTLVPRARSALPISVCSRRRSLEWRMVSLPLPSGRARTSGNRLWVPSSLVYLQNCSMGRKGQPTCPQRPVGTPRCSLQRLHLRHIAHPPLPPNICTINPAFMRRPVLSPLHPGLFLTALRLQDRRDITPLYHPGRGVT